MTATTTKPHEIILELYEPHEMQRKLHESRARYRVAAWGRQAGKSTWGINELAYRAWENPGHVYWFISPTYNQSKVIYRRLKESLQDLIACGYLKKNDSDLALTFQHGAIIQCKSGQEYNNLRTETLNGVIIDEVREQSPDLWKLVIRPMLTTTKGWAVFISTPNGFDSFYDLAEKAKNDTRGAWAYFNAPSTCNPLFTQNEYDEAMRDMSEAEFAQEILAEFRDLQNGSAYINFGAHNLKSMSPFTKDGALTSPYLPVRLYMDFNVSPMCWTLSQMREGSGHYVFDELHLNKSHTQEAGVEIVERIKRLAIQAKPQVILVGDASGKANKTSAGGNTDYTILGQILDSANITWVNQTPESNPAVKDRVNTVNARLRAADGTVSVWIHPTRCPNLKRDLERVCWKKGATVTLDQTTDATLTHASDGLGYGLCVAHPLQQSGGVGSVRVIRRDQ